MTLAIDQAAKLRKRRRDKVLAAIVPLGVYLSFVGLAFAIGNKHSCATGFVNWGLYFHYGVAALLALFVLQLCLNRTVHLLWRIAFALATVAAGAGIWIWAFDAGGLYFMCRLF